MRAERDARKVLAALALLYTAQGVPFGFAAEYLPVVLREQHFSRTAIAMLGWLQAPWQLKVLWASVGDHARVRPHARTLLLAVQALLALTLAAYVPALALGGMRAWFVLTFIAAVFAATQDIFVDAFAVRSLAAKDRGYGNTAQIAGYRVGIILGGGGMLAASELLGATATMLGCAGLVLLAGAGAFALRNDAAEPEVAPRAKPATGGTLALCRALVGRDRWAVAALALTYKLGAHAASALVKPALVDAGWSRASIGAVVVTMGTGAAIAGSVAGGVLHRLRGDRGALGVAAVVQALATLPLLTLFTGHISRAAAGVAIAAEHLASGLGTTVLFAALMSATDRSRAALHYTALTSLNAVAIGVGGLLGATLADAAGPVTAVLASAALCVAPVALLRRWDAHAAQSAGAADSLTERGGSH